MSVIPELPPGIDLSMIPAGTPPAGVVPQLAGGENQETVVWAVGLLFPILTFFFVFARVWVNVRNKERKIGLDDVTCVLAYIFGLGFVGLMISLRKYTRHGWDIPLSWLADPQYMQKTSSELLLMFIAQFFAKSSILLLYLRVFSPKPAIRYMIWGAIVFAFCIYGFSIPLTAIYCMPAAGQEWNIEVGSNCSHTMISGMVQGICNVILDIFILALPLRIVSKLNIKRQRKIAILVVFATGFIAFIASVVGLAYKVILWQHQYDDPSWYNFTALICLVVEINATIACSCMPPLAYFASTIRERMSSLSSLRTRLFGRSARSSSTVGKEGHSPPRTSKAESNSLHKAYSTSGSSSNQDAGFLELRNDGSPSPRTQTHIQSLPHRDEQSESRQGIRKEMTYEVEQAR